jgi:hypothetical protein
MSTIFYLGHAKSAFPWVQLQIDFQQSFEHLLKPSDQFVFSVCPDNEVVNVDFQNFVNEIWEDLGLHSSLKVSGNRFGTHGSSAPLVVAKVGCKAEKFATRHLHLHLIETLSTVHGCEVLRSARGDSSQDSINVRNRPTSRFHIRVKYCIIYTKSIIFSICLEDKKN